MCSKHIEDFGFQWKKGIDSATAVRECFTLGPDLCVPIQSCNLIGLELQIETKSFTLRPDLQVSTMNGSPTWLHFLIPCVGT
jgi:hypothetical protein